MELSKDFINYGLSKNLPWAPGVDPLVGLRALREARNNDVSKDMVSKGFVSPTDRKSVV